MTASLPVVIPPGILGELLKVFFKLSIQQTVEIWGSRVLTHANKAPHEILAKTIVLGVGCGTDTSRYFIYACSHKRQFICTFFTTFLNYYDYFFSQILHFCDFCNALPLLQQNIRHSVYKEEIPILISCTPYASRALQWVSSEWKAGIVSLPQISQFSYDKFTVWY